MKKNIIFVLFFMSCINLAGQTNRISYDLNKKSDSLTGFFYLYVGGFHKGIFHLGRNVSVDLYDGFYYSYNNVFNPDTNYSLVEKRTSAFVEMLDSLKLNYSLYPSTYFSYDSLTSIYFDKKNIKSKPHKKKDKEVFLKIKMTVFYNHSFIRDNNVTYKFAFNKKGEMTTLYNNRELYFKPILYFKILSPPTYYTEVFNLAKGKK